MGQFKVSHHSFEGYSRLRKNNYIRLVHSRKKKITKSQYNFYI